MSWTPWHQIVMVSRMSNSSLQPLSNLSVSDSHLRELVDAGVAGYAVEETERELRLYVVFAEGHGDRVPWELCEEEGVGRAMMEAANAYGDGWTISVLDAEVVPTADMQRLAMRLSILDTWDEFVGLPEGACTACGGRGYLEMDRCTPAGEMYVERGDCDGCDSTGRL